MEEQQYVIMFNDYPEEVCAPDTSPEAAAARAVQIKEDYLKQHASSVNPNMLHIRACAVRVFRS